MKIQLGIIGDRLRSSKVYLTGGQKWRELEKQYLEKQ